VETQITRSENKMYIEDQQRKGFKVYREHTTDVPQEFKSVQFGLAVTDQDDQTAAYTTENIGDESGWVFWETASTTGAYRATGSWAQSWLVVVGAAGVIYPVKTGALVADTSFAAKTVVITSSTGDLTKATSVAGVVPDSGTFGIVHQGSAQDSYEFLFSPIGGGGTSFDLAKIRWFVDLEGDRSEGELLTYDNATDTYTASGTAIYIDWAKSKACKFETAGDNTVFAVTKIASSVVRYGVTRDLYACVYCEKDAGSRITHLRKSGANSLYLYGTLISEDILPSPSMPWENATLAAPKTSIVGIPGVNVISARVPKEWDITTAGWDWTEISDFSRGMPWYFRPIEPMLMDKVQRVWRSEFDFAGNPLSTYGRKA